MPSTWSQEKYIAALRYAAEAHHGQTVPGSDLPYVIHVTMVAMEVIAALAHEDDLNGDLAVQCALLHDVIEDTEKNHADIAAVFGKRVADGVQALSKDKKVGADLDDHIEKKRLQMIDSLSRIKLQPTEIAMVKIADRVTNLQPPPKKWFTKEGKIARYRKEAEKILSELGEASKFLYERLHAKIGVYPGHNETC